MKLYTFLLGTILFFFLPCKAQQYTLSGTVKDGSASNSVMESVQIILSAQDTLAGIAMTDAKGRFALKNLPAGNYVLHIEHPGYSPVKNEYDLQGNMNVEFLLYREMSMALDSVVVTADPSLLARRTATGTIYRLSEQAKNSKDPYRALEEIPQLNVNASLRSVTLANGSSPLILINGNQMNSGIAPIDPKDIESVEVVEVVSARYLKDNVQSILNIKLKDKAKPFVFFEAMNRHNIPVNYGIGALYFEIGNPKFSIYARTAGYYLHHDDTESSYWQRNTGYYKEGENNIRKNGTEWEGELLLKWLFTPKDYLAAYLYKTGESYTNRQEGTGVLTTDAAQPFTREVYGWDDSYILTASLYHKHTFSDDKRLESRLYYNRNRSRDTEDQYESYPDWDYLNNYRYRSTRNSLRMNVDYSMEWGKNSLSAGSDTRFVNDHINLLSSSSPMFHHREWSEYLYGLFGSRINKLQYMLSLGAEGIWLKAGDVSHHYFKPRGSASATYTINNYHSFRAGYTLSNTTPSVSMLNPYNTSSDSLIVTKGNPYLKPTQNHDFSASYTYYRKGFYIAPTVYYQYSHDMTEAYGYSENGIYTSSYRNAGHYRNAFFGSYISYYNNQKWGGLYVQPFHCVQYFEGQPARKSFYIKAGGHVRYKKFMFNTEWTYTNYDYTSVTRTRYHAPKYSLVQLTYNFTPLFYISAAVEYVTGAKKSDIYTYSGDYTSLQSLTLKDKNVRPWILIRYTFRKNMNRKIKLDKVLNSTEEGISLKKKETD